jgi:Ran GTPase-activating protein (RanGAP) involved in mRNA processing and transport
MATLDLTGNELERNAGAADSIAAGLRSNSTLMEINLSSCGLGDGGLSSLAQILGTRRYRNSRVGTLLGAMEQSSHITDLDLQRNPIRDEGASRLARSVRNNALRNLARLSLRNCGIDHDGFIALVSALKQKTSLLHLHLRSNYYFTEQAFLALADQSVATT